MLSDVADDRFIVLGRGCGLRQIMAPLCREPVSSSSEATLAIAN
jgi:hypothetical protein